MHLCHHMLGYKYVQLEYMNQILRIVMSGIELIAYGV